MKSASAKFDPDHPESCNDHLIEAYNIVQRRVKLFIKLLILIVFC